MSLLFAYKILRTFKKYACLIGVQYLASILSFRRVPRRKSLALTRGNIYGWSGASPVVSAPPCALLDPVDLGTICLAPLLLRPTMMVTRR